MTQPRFGGVSSSEETVKGKGPKSLGDQVVSIASTVEEPNELRISPSRLAIPAADYLSSTLPLSLLDTFIANRLGH